VTWTPTILGGGTSSLIQVAYTFAADGSDTAQLSLYTVEVRDAVSGGRLPNQAFSFYVVQANEWTGP
jgi:hypothetical protein